MIFSKKFLQFQKDSQMEPYVACVGWSNTMKYSSLLDKFQQHDFGVYSLALATLRDYFVVMVVVKLVGF